MKHPRMHNNAVLPALALLASLQWASAQTIPANLAAPANSVDTTKPGFKVRTVRVTGLQVNNVNLAEAIINGKQINPTTGQP